MKWIHQIAGTLGRELRWALPWPLLCGLLLALLSLLGAWQHSREAWTVWSPEKSHWSLSQGGGAITVTRSDARNQNPPGAHPFGRLYSASGLHARAFAAPEIQLGEIRYGETCDWFVLPYWLIVLSFLSAATLGVCAKIICRRRGVAT
ncbi:MAG: hypothetical protein AAF733_09000 [Verrucomicrobiota bacterium]